MLQNFQMSYPEVQIETVFISSDMETVITNNGNPDIILSDRDAWDTIGDLIDKDIIWEFSDLYYEDDTILKNNYFEGALDSCKFGESVYAEQLRNQLAHITFAQISDQEVLKIRQETLTEAVDSGLSAEAGFELLCQRLIDWYQ